MGPSRISTLFAINYLCPTYDYVDLCFQYMSQAQMKQAMKTVRNMCIPKSGVDKGELKTIQFKLRPALGNGRREFGTAHFPDNCRYENVLKCTSE